MGLCCRERTSTFSTLRRRIDAIVLDAHQFSHTGVMGPNDVRLFAEIAPFTFPIITLQDGECAADNAPVGCNVWKGSDFPDSVTGTVQYVSTIIRVRGLASLLCCMVLMSPIG